LLVPGRTALVLMDFMPLILGRIGGGEQLLERMAGAASAARAAGLPVVHVRVAFRPGHPEISPANRTFSRLAGAGMDLTEANPDAGVHPALGPEPGDVVVTKRRVSAFTGSDFAVVLRAAGVDTLVLAGIATSGVVLSTLRQAADLDYRLVVLADGCADTDDEVHRVLLEKVFPGQAEVVGTADWIAGLSGS
jgi:nicotinamidase-related amidase